MIIESLIREVIEVEPRISGQSRKQSTVIIITLSVINRKDLKESLVYYVGRQRLKIQKDEGNN